NAYSENYTNEEIKEIKQAMIRAVESPKITDSLYMELTSKKSPTALVTAYIGTLEALKAKHSWNPYNKMKFVAQSQKTLQNAIEKDPHNIEIRFMRFSIQHFTPAFLGYSKELSIDRKEIVKLFKRKSFGVADSGLISNIAKFMIDSKRCSPADLAVLKSFV
ncbi:MAG: hypothetical protein ABI390_06955, partial [Daejeonella sp.]